MNNPKSKAACVHCTPPETTTQPPKSGFGFLQYTLDSIEELPEIQEVLEDITLRRRRARPGYAPRSMLRLFCLKYLLNEEYNNQLLYRLEESPKLRELCGLGEGLPAQNTVSRFFRHMTEQRDLIEKSIPRMVDRLREHLPDMGKVVSIDATDIESFANPSRDPCIDENARWGVRTPKNRFKRRNTVEYFHGYKMHMIADAVHDVPLSYRLLPANKNEVSEMAATVENALNTYECLKPTYLIGDRGYDSLRNHKFLVNLDIIPIIHIRKPIRTKYHDSIYTKLGSPTCVGGKEMTYIRTDPETGHHLFSCPEGGCKKFEKKVFPKCGNSQWENPADNLRVIGIVPRKSKKWSDLFKLRGGIERYFGSGKQSRLLNKHRYLTMDKILTHVALSVLTYLATMYAQIKAGSTKKKRHMRVMN